VYTPIEDFTLKDVWDYLDLFPNPWGVDNALLRELYESAQGECPLVIDTLTPSCGNTRFGCWVCTVVDRDRSMEAIAESGDEWIRPLLKFRDGLVSTQDPANKPRQRKLVRRDGRVWVKKGKLIWGPYEFESDENEEKEEVRKDLLRKLLRTQAEVRKLGPDPKMTLIQPEELHAIRRIWRSEEGDWADVLPQIYKEETGETLDWVQDDTGIFGTQEEDLLREACKTHNVPHKLVKLLLGTTQAHDGMRHRYRIYDKYDKIISRDWRSDEEILASVLQKEEAGSVGA
jgi:DNA sulfur modification protein DndC